MKLPLLLLPLVLISFTCRAEPSALQRFHDDAERDFQPKYARLATGILDKTKLRMHNPWPVKILSIGHTIASYQNYGGGPYFHHGLDIRADAGSDVIASVGGKVINVENYEPGNPAYWEIAILDDFGFIWQYHHVEYKSIPQAIHTAFKTGGRIEAGTKIGEVFYWGNSTFGERYHHVHLNVLGAERKYVNPFYFLTPLDDKSSPTIEGMGIFRDPATRALSLFIEAKDLVMHDKFFVPPYHLEVQIDGGPRMTVWRFDNLPGGASNTDKVHDFFVASKTCGNYSCRRFTMNAAFSPEIKTALANLSGAHTATIYATDFAGNSDKEDYPFNFDRLTLN